MAGQSQAPQLLLTRPLAQSRRFARELRAAWGAALDVTISPLMVTAFLTPALPDGPYQTLIFSSETGVSAYGALPRLAAARAFCVGERTAQAARKAGLQIIAIGEDVATLISRIIATGIAGPLLHLRGEDSRGDVAPSLTAAGIPTDEVVIYRQDPQPLTRAAQRRLAGSRPIILPLFSPRSAALFCVAQDSTAPLHIVALSPAVAAAVAATLQARIMIAKSATGPAMMRAVIDLLMEPPFA